MDDSHRHRLANSRYAVRLLAIVLTLALAGCKQLGLGQSKNENPVVPPPPDRNVPLNSQTGNRQTGESQTSSAKPTAPIKLDGSAAGESASAIPNAPGIAGAAVLAGPGAQGSSAADDAARLRAANDEASGKAKGVAQSDALSAPSDELDESPTLELPANDRRQETPRATRDAARTTAAAPPKTGARSKVGAAADKSADAAGGDAADGATNEKPGKITPVGKVEDNYPLKLDLLPEATADVVTPIEIEGDGATFVKGQVAATVNGVPIFCDDVLRVVPDEVARGLAQLERAAAEGKVKPEAYRDYRRRAVAHYMKDHIQQELLLQALKLRLKPEQMTGLIKQLDKIFDTEDLPLAIKKAGVNTATELEQKLQAQGSSIESLRAASRNRQMAQQYLGKEAALNLGYDRPDIRKYYEENKESYAITAKVKWEQIQLKFNKNGGKEGALKKAEEIKKQLDAGEVFAVIASKCSDGPTAANGGLWSWTVQGSIKAKEIDQALFELPIGEISEPIETQASVDIIRVIDRTEAGYERFEDVQEDIKNHLKMTLFQKRVNDLMKDLKEKANIEDFTDKL
jgi:parvulin-like peptidyl-prolyl isomerase